MALLPPIRDGRETQQFGPSSLGIEPAVFADGTRRAWWQPFRTWRHVEDYHTGLDIAAPAGSVIVASEAGEVTESYFDSTNGGGHKVTVEIRPGVTYTSNHCQTRLVPAGRWVKRGDPIARVGNSGWAFGAHDHFAVAITDEGRGIMWNPKLFLPGGSRAGDERIKPRTPPVQHVLVNGAGVNLRTSPDLDRRAANIWATTKSDGIYRNRVKRAALTYRFELRGTQDNEDGKWFRVYGLGQRLFLNSRVAHVA